MVVSPLIPVYNMAIDFKGIYGNESLKSYFSDCISNNCLPHAFVLEGKKGSGRSSFAAQIASAAMCTGEHKPCGICKNCRQIGDGVAPDVRITGLADDRANIPVDAIRAIRNDAVTVPCEGDYKFYIIKDSEKMNVYAQNALLKILEEPPSFVVFILICENSGLLLPTVRSRAPVFKMQNFTDEELGCYLADNCSKAKQLLQSDKSAFENVIKSSDGAIGAALSNLDKRSYGRIAEQRNTVCSMIKALTGVEKSLFYSYEDELSSKRDEFNSFVFDLRTAFRDILIRKKKGTSEYVFFESDEQVSEFSLILTAESLIRCIETCDTVLNYNDQNANMNLLKINYICTLWKCVH